MHPEATTSCGGTMRARGQAIRCVLAVAATIVVAAACGAPLSADEAISLNESCLVAVPARQPISGASIDERGAMVFWSRRSSELWVAQVGMTQARALRLAPGSDIVSAAIVDGTIELVDGGRRQILLLDKYGALKTKIDVDLPIRVQAAARLPQAWVVGGEGIGGGVVVAVQESAGFRELEIPKDDGEGGWSRDPRGDFGRDMSTGDGFFLQAAGTAAVLISWVQRPYRAGVVRTRGLGHWLPSLTDEQLRGMGANEKGWNLWSALPAILIKDGLVVQTMADLGSTSRQMLVRRANGTPIRLTKVEAPVGLIGVSPAGKTVLAFTRVPEPTVRCYDVEQ